MSEPLIWLHEKSLCAVETANQWVNAAASAPQAYPSVHIWDEAYYQSRGYSFKRLLFIYECLHDLQIPIIRGDTLNIMNELKPSTLYIPKTADTAIRALSDKLRQQCHVELISPSPLCDLPDDMQATRFFKFWHKAKKSALLST